MDSLAKKKNHLIDLLSFLVVLCFGGAGDKGG